MSIAQAAVGAQGRAALPESRIVSATFLLAGLLMQFNGYVGGLRYSDLACLAFISVCLLLALRRGAVLLPVVIAALAVSGLLAVSVVGFQGMASNDRVWLLRCHAAVLFGALFWFSSDRLRTRFAIGIVAGGVMGFAVALLEVIGFGAALAEVGLRSSVAASRGLGTLDQLGLTVRATGMWGDANEFGPVGSLVVVASLFLLDRTPAARAMLWISLSCVALNALFLSYNRSALIATAVSVLVYLLASQRQRIVGLLSRAVVAAVLALLIVRVAFPELTDAVVTRYSIDAAGENLEGRLASLRAALVLILEYPAGLSSQLWPDLLRSLSWVANPHNGFLSTAFGAGLAFGCFSFLAVVYCVFSRDPFYRILALHVLVIFLFETLNFSPGIVCLLGILWTKPVIDMLLAGSRKSAPGRPPHGGLSRQAWSGPR